MANPEHLAILKQGVQVWNEWRTSTWNDYRELHPDLSEADLRGMDLGDANLRITNLVEADLTGANLSGADLSEYDPWPESPIYIANL